MNQAGTGFIQPISYPMQSLTRLLVCRLSRQQSASSCDLLHSKRRNEIRGNNITRNSLHCFRAMISVSPCHDAHMVKLVAICAWRSALGEAHGA